MSYWDDINEFKKKEHNRLIEYIDKQHKYKMKELDKEVELFLLKEKVKKSG